MDRIHDQSTLDRSEAAQSAIPSLQFLHDEPVSDAVQSGTSVTLQVGPKVTQFAHRLDQFRWEASLHVVVFYNRNDLIFHEGANAVPYQPLLIAQEVFKPQEIHALECHCLGI